MLFSSFPGQKLFRSVSFSGIKGADMGQESLSPTPDSEQQSADCWYDEFRLTLRSQGQRSVDSDTTNSGRQPLQVKVLGSHVMVFLLGRGFLPEQKLCRLCCFCLPVVTWQHSACDSSKLFSHCDNSRLKPQWRRLGLEPCIQLWYTTLVSVADCEKLQDVQGRSNRLRGARTVAGSI